MPTMLRKAMKRLIPAARMAVNSELLANCESA